MLIHVVCRYILLITKHWFLPYPKSACIVGWRTKSIRASRKGQHIKVTSLRPIWRLKSPATILLNRKFVKANNKENNYWSFVMGLQRRSVDYFKQASSAESVSVSWRHHTSRALPNLIYAVFTETLTLVSFNRRGKEISTFFNELRYVIDSEICVTNVCSKS